MAIESAFALQVVNVILLAILISIYVRNLMKMKSNFALGLLIFAGFLLIQNLIGIYLGVEYLGGMTEQFENYAFAINFTETMALLALFWISWK